MPYDKKTSKDPRKATGEMGILTINNQPYTDFELGYPDDLLSEHAEQKIVDWTEKIIEDYKGVKGTVR